MPPSVHANFILKSKHMIVPSWMIIIKHLYSAISENRQQNSNRTWMLTYFDNHPLISALSNLHIYTFCIDVRCHNILISRLGSSIKIADYILANVILKHHAWKHIFMYNIMTKHIRHWSKGLIAWYVCVGLHYS